MRQGEDKTEKRNKEREGKQKREKQAPETKPLFCCSDLFERLFPFFLTPLRVCQRIIISLQNYISSLKEPHTITVARH